MTTNAVGWNRADAGRAALVLNTYVPSSVVSTFHGWHALGQAFTAPNPTAGTVTSFARLSVDPLSIWLGADTDLDVLDAPHRQGSLSIEIFMAPQIDEPTWFELLKNGLQALIDHADEAGVILVSRRLVGPVVSSTPEESGKGFPGYARAALTVPYWSVDGSVVVHLPLVSLSTNYGAAATPVLRSNYLAGASFLEIEDDGGDGLAGHIPDFTKVVIGAATYSVLDREIYRGGMSFTVSPALSAPASAGDPITFQASTVSVDQVISLAAESAKDKNFFDRVDFAFQFRVQDYNGEASRSYRSEPPIGSRCVRTTGDGSSLIGTVLGTSTDLTMTQVWCEEERAN